MTKPPPITATPYFHPRIIVQIILEATWDELNDVGRNYDNGPSMAREILRQCGFERGQLELVTRTQPILPDHVLLIDGAAGLLIWATIMTDLPSPMHTLARELEEYWTRELGGTMPDNSRRRVIVSGLETTFVQVVRT